MLGLLTSGGVIALVTVGVPAVIGLILLGLAGSGRRRR
jgi:uncharacterized protein (TIGR03382 family)